MNHFLLAAGPPSAHAVHVNGKVVAGAVAAVLVLWLFRRRVGAPVPPRERYGFLWPLIAVGGLAVVVAEAAHRPAVTPAPAPHVIPPPKVIIHTAQAHPLLNGTQIVWIVAIVAAVVVALGVNKIIHK